MPEQVNLGKLMVAYGRNANFDIFMLGGHAENAGAFATTYIYVGFLEVYYIGFAGTGDDTFSQI